MMLSSFRLMVFKPSWCARHKNVPASSCARHKLRTHTKRCQRAHDWLGHIDCIKERASERNGHFTVWSVGAHQHQHQRRRRLSLEQPGGTGAGSSLAGACCVVSPKRWG